MSNSAFFTPKEEIFIFGEFYAGYRYVDLSAGEMLSLRRSATVSIKVKPYL